MKMMTMIVVVAGAIVAAASPLSAPVKLAVREASERAGAHAATKAGEHALVHGGAALAKVTAEREAAKAASRAAVGDVVGKVSGKQILAAGGATALVVGVHEVADGAQTACEAASDAIRENPELAPSIVSRVFAPVTTVAVMIWGVVLSVLAWLLWPFLVAARNLIRLAAARRLRAAELVQEKLKPTEARAGSAGYVRVGTLVWVVCGFILLTALGIWRAIDSGAYVWVVNPTRARTIADIRAKHDEAVNRHLEAFRADVDATATKEFGRVRASVPRVADKFGTFSKCAALVKAIVCDKLGGGNQTANEINSDLEADYYRGLYAANDAVARCLGRLKENLEQESREFRAEIEKELASGQSLGDEEYRKLLESCGDRVEAVKRDLFSAQLDAGISMAIEAICVRQTVKTVGCILGRAAARQAGTMAAGAGAACVDGPLPVGDIIAIVSIAGCTAWTGWDVYKATTILPRELSGTLVDAVNNCERQCREEIVKRGEEMAAGIVSAGSCD